MGQIVMFLASLLSKTGSRFVLLLLGLESTASNSLSHGGSGGPAAVTSTSSSSVNKKRPRDATSASGGGDAAGGVLPQVTPSLSRKIANRADSIATAAAAAASITGSAPRSGRRLTPPTPLGAVLDLQTRLGSVDRRLVSALVLYWMRLIRSLDCFSGSKGHSDVEGMVVTLVLHLNSLLGDVMSHLSAQDCDYVLLDVADTFHEYIYRSNTSSWNSSLNMSENLFSFLESSRNTESMV